ncbi:GTPase Era family protein [Skeletonema marinoi]|uniref:GTPase Era family protein n=1 Tax=Skeletonema marinoi TaxID=267567 RepID=A0AAD8Y308_9STRA|nr:GTPase Era family protein [Skeletonema marinoi]
MMCLSIHHVFTLVALTSFSVAARSTIAFVGKPISQSHNRHTASHHKKLYLPSSLPSTVGVSKRLTSHLYGKDKYKNDSDTPKLTQNELLLQLETKLEYDGRISSKVSQQDNAITSSDDDETTTDDDNEETVVSSTHRCALVTILGLPNMGKSTLLNALLSDDLAIATNRPQTTRHAILGVMTTDHSQICLTDTPGIIGSPAYRLQEGMMDVVNGAVRDCDVFLVVTDVYSGGKMDMDGDDDDDDDDENLDKMGIGEDMLVRLQQAHRPVIVVVNKVDLVADTDESVYTNTPVKAIQTIQKWRSVLPDAFAIIPTCAANGPDDQGVVALRSILLANDPDVNVGAAIRNLGRPVAGMFPSSSGGMPTNEEAKAILPLGPPLYHADFFTDRTDRFCASELIRETLFETLKKEMPYCCEVRIEIFDESKRYLDEDSPSGSNNKKNKSMIRIGALILVERDSQKGIVVGKGGQKIKDVGMDARKKLQAFFGVKIFLDLRVKVDKDWRSNKEKLKQYGYM